MMPNEAEKLRGESDNLLNWNAKRIEFSACFILALLKAERSAGRNRPRFSGKSGGGLKIQADTAVSRRISPAFRRYRAAYRRLAAERPPDFDLGPNRLAIRKHGHKPFSFRGGMSRDSGAFAMDSLE